MVSGTIQDERIPRVESELERLRKKVENFPSASAYNRLAELLRLGGDVDAAQQVCRRCIKEFPRNGHAYVILADIELTTGKKDEGIKNLLIAVERDPRSYTAHRMLADHFSAIGRQTEALQHLRAILSFKANDPIVLQKIEQLTGKPVTKTANQAPIAETPANPTPANPQPILPLQLKGNPGDGMANLCREAGVRGALIADSKGRVISSTGISAEQETLLAAFAAEIGTAATQSLQVIGQEQLTSWAVAAAQGQVLAFRRDASFCVMVLAEPGVRPAMLELRARQALTDLGGA
jgi:predicted regulator of Ras-like GTPase activity (Roadblock/LC7/MglB family)